MMILIICNSFVHCARRHGTEICHARISHKSKRRWKRVLPDKHLRFPHGPTNTTNSLRLALAAKLSLRNLMAAMYVTLFLIILFLFFPLFQLLYFHFLFLFVCFRSFSFFFVSFHFMELMFEQHMTCVSCKFQFCWMCLSEYTGVHFNDIVNYPNCYMKQYCILLSFNFAFISSF